MILAASKSSDTGDSWATLPASVTEEMLALRQALRDSHDRLRHCALESTKRICALTNDLTRLEQLNAGYRKKLDLFENLSPLDGMARCLESCRRENEVLRQHNQHVRMLEKALADAKNECLAIAAERDDLALKLDRRLSSRPINAVREHDVYDQ